MGKGGKGTDYALKTFIFYLLMLKNVNLSRIAIWRSIFEFYLVHQLETERNRERGINLFFRENAPFTDFRLPLFHSQKVGKLFYRVK